MKKIIFLIASVLVVLVVTLSGCLVITLSNYSEKEAPKYAKPSKIIQETSTNEQQLELLKKVTHAEVWDYGRNWDEDAENDGIALYIRLLDEKDEVVEFSDVNIPVEIKIYTLKYENGRPLRDKLIYNGSAVMTSWRDGSLAGPGIRIPFEDINFTDINKAKEGIDYEIYVKIKLPTNKTIETKRTGYTKWWFYD